MSAFDITVKIPLVFMVCSNHTVMHLSPLPGGIESMSITEVFGGKFLIWKVVCRTGTIVTVNTVMIPSIRSLHSVVSRGSVMYNPSLSLYLVFR